MLPRRISPRRVVAWLAVLAVAAGALYVSTLPLGGGVGAHGTFSPRASVVPGVEVGQAAPDFVSTDGAARALLTDLDGRQVHLADYAGRPVWLVFWAVSCAPCVEEAPQIVAAYHAHRDEGLAVLAIDEQEPTGTVRSFAREHGLDYAIGLDPTAEAKALYGWGLPLHLFLDAHGVIRDRYIGQLSPAQMEERLAEILGS